MQLQANKPQNFANTALLCHNFLKNKHELCNNAPFQRNVAQFEYFAPCDVFSNVQHQFARFAHTGDLAGLLTVSVWE
jgi:hypothetical protein